MTVTSSTSKSRYTGNGVTTAFTGSFRILDEDQVTVTHTSTVGVDTTKTITTDYTVSGVGGSSFTVTHLVAPASGVTVTLSRNVPATQELDLVENDDMPADELEKAFDKTTMLVQQIDEAVDRAIRFPVSDSTSRTSELPAASLRAGKIIGFDADGDVIVSTEDLEDIEGSIAESAASAAAAAASASAASASASAASASASTASTAAANLPNATTAGANKVVVSDTLGTGWLYKSIAQFLAFIGTGTPDATTFLRGDGAWATPPASGYRNRIINGDFTVNQRAVTTAADDVYHLDRWYALNQSGSQTVAQQTLQENGARASLRITQPDVGAKRIGIAQIVESVNCVDLRGQSVTLSGRIRCSASQAIRYAILEHTGTADSVTSDVVNDWTSSTYTASNFFAAGFTVVGVGSITPSAATWTDITALTGSVSSSATNLIAVFWSEGTLAQNATLDFNRIQLEAGSSKTTFESIDYGDQIRRCQRYLPAINSDSTGCTLGSAYAIASTTAIGIWTLAVRARATPTGISVSSASHVDFVAGGAAYTASAVAFSNASPAVVTCSLTITGATNGQGGAWRFNSASGQLLFTGCEL